MVHRIDSRGRRSLILVLALALPTIVAACGDDGGGGDQPVEVEPFCRDFSREVCRRLAPSEEGGRGDPRYDAGACERPAINDRCATEGLTLEDVFEVVFGDVVSCAATRAEANACIDELEDTPVSVDESEIVACGSLCTFP